MLKLLRRLTKIFSDTKTIKELYSLSDRDLKDIGISRGQIPYIIYTKIR